MEKLFTVIVGGRSFSLSESSIRRDAPNYFTAAFLGSFSETSTQLLVIDRNPILFQLIHEHLQGYDIFSLPTSSGISSRGQLDECHNNLLLDAQYYGLSGLIKQLEEIYKPTRYTSRHTYHNPFLMHKKHLACNLRDLDVQKLLLDDSGFLVWQDPSLPDAKKYGLHIHAQECILALGLHRSDEVVKVSLEFHDVRDIKIIEELTNHFGPQKIKSEKIAEDKVKISAILKGKTDISDVFLDVDDIPCTLWELLHFRDYLVDINVTGPKRQRMLELDNIIYNDWVFGDKIYGRFYVVDIDFTLPPLYMHRAKLMSEQRWTRDLRFVKSS
ncbi:hypothetical protein G9A89_016232 [Geosiphon pyriformis]|nr:hypothetical protein G9A89_016232 [Geosiphon pyriformis]